jgi:hypothetical protein
MNFGRWLEFELDMEKENGIKIRIQYMGQIDP